jgi:hypothetical protein
MSALRLLFVAALVEAALIIFPQAVARLLLGAELAGAGIAVARVAGIALLSLGLLCRMSRRDANNSHARLQSAGDGVPRVLGVRW